MKFEIYRDAAGRWRWRLKARNGEIIADPGFGYSRKAGALAAIKRLQRVDLSLVKVVAC
ncbi:YegP family protein [Caldimonas sp. KR1-144]|uniref:YegP family protein n=1 Tax=Caldimonas sp. KR1-144 TaxID=3400911 RepID=UPI003C0C7DA3